MVYRPYHPLKWELNVDSFQNFDYDDRKDYDEDRHTAHVKIDLHFNPKSEQLRLFRVPLIPDAHSVSSI